MFPFLDEAESEIEDELHDYYLSSILGIELNIGKIVYYSLT